jgi:transcriptional regulator with GAF, ATPase, and Fis domain
VPLNCSTFATIVVQRKSLAILHATAIKIAAQAAQGRHPLLVNHFVAKFNKKTGKKILSVLKEALNVLQEYHWPGNVRELESVVERAVITSQEGTLQVLDRFDTFRKKEEESVDDVKAFAAHEQDHILQVLQKTGWRIEGPTGAAVLLGLNPSPLRARMRKYGIRRQ